MSVNDYMKFKIMLKMCRLIPLHLTSRKQEHKDIGKTIYVIKFHWQYNIALVKQMFNYTII